MNAVGTDYCVKRSIVSLARCTGFDKRFVEI